MKRKHWLLLGGVVIAIGVVAGVYFLSQLAYLNELIQMKPLEITFSTEITPKPDNVACLGGEDSPGIAKEILNLETDIIYVGGGDNVIADDEWENLGLGLPWIKNSTRHLLFDGSCFFRSPGAPADCDSDDCFISETHFDHTWYKLNTIEGQSCFPDASGCSGDVVNAGYISISTIAKCHEIIYNGPIIYELSDGKGNLYVMHATDDGMPNIDGVQLPNGWTLTEKTISEPLVILPVGGGTDCYYNIVRDNTVQSYHQFAYGEDVYPPTNE